MKLIKSGHELRDLAIVYLTRANGSVYDAIDSFEGALSEASPVLAALFGAPNDALRAQIAIYLDGIQSDLAYLFQEGIAKDEAVAKETKAAPLGTRHDAAILTLEGAAKHGARIVPSPGDERAQRS